MSEALKKYQYDDILGTLDGAKGFFINASDVGNFDIAMKIIEKEKNRRAQPDNPPLTLEQLKQMDNQPVWTDKRCGVVRAEPQITRRPGMPAIHFNYGWEWADDVFTCGPVYAHKPEKDGDEE
jgi:hypothetical protein